eukprot:gb/GFBE01071469.1/.p1 GENE.gb/GFBE01071469.1/~~gb/GFBE01071469.1/.p1  ORF type:complete len:172 (+),score=37.25 gb/GFBE01071469.1/:1-516(+)
MWIGGRKGRMGGNPSNVKRHAGDLPADPDVGGGGGYGRRNLYAMLLKGAGEGLAGAHIEQPRLPVWKNGMMMGSSASGIEAPMAPPPDFPPWIQVDAHLCYKSNTGKILEVVVEKISVAKGEVKVTFADNPKIWKIIKIDAVTSKDSPLLGLWGQVDKDSEGRGRSRSPRK